MSKAYVVDTSDKELTNEIVAGTSGKLMVELRDRVGNLISVDAY